MRDQYLFLAQAGHPPSDLKLARLLGDSDPRSLARQRVDFLVCDAAQIHRLAPEATKSFHPE
jgi:hypothetical protein